MLSEFAIWFEFELCEMFAVELEAENISGLSIWKKYLVCVHTFQANLSWIVHLHWNYLKSLPAA